VRATSDPAASADPHPAADASSPRSAVAGSDLDPVERRWRSSVAPPRNAARLGDYRQHFGVGQDRPRPTGRTIGALPFHVYRKKEGAEVDPNPGLVLADQTPRQANFPYV